MPALALLGPMFTLAIISSGCHGLSLLLAKPITHLMLTTYCPVKVSSTIQQTNSDE